MDHYKNDDENGYDNDGNAATAEKKNEEEKEHNKKGGADSNNDVTDTRRPKDKYWRDANARGGGGYCQEDMR